MGGGGGGGERGGEIFFTQKIIKGDFRKLNANEKGDQKICMGGRGL